MMQAPGAANSSANSMKRRRHLRQCHAAPKTAPSKIPWVDIPPSQAAGINSGFAK